MYNMAEVCDILEKADDRRAARRSLLLERKSNASETEQQNDPLDPTDNSGPKRGLNGALYDHNSTGDFGQLTNGHSPKADDNGQSSGTSATNTEPAPQPYVRESFRVEFDSAGKWIEVEGVWYWLHPE